jgi:class 3 adenylate cyclase
MERETATVLFTDIVGSTQLLIAHGDRYDAVRRAHDSALRSVVEANGGRVVKGMGDGFMCLFDAVADAVVAARSAQQAILRLNHAGHEPQLSIRVGLAVGDVVREDDDCFGEAVVAAARLCAVAEGDQILASRLVRDLVGARAEGFEHVGVLPLKGLPEPVEAFAVVWERLAAAPTPLPARLVDATASFVGRSHELDRLHTAFGRVGEEGRRRVVLIGGEAGAGKTTLLGQAARAWHEAGASVAVGGCEEHVRAPYRPFIEALDHLVGAAPAELLLDHLARHGPGIAALAPSIRRRVDRLPDPVRTDPETERYLLFAAVSDLLDALTDLAPVVLLLEDLHWADDATASLLRSLSTVADPARLLIACTFRNDELAGDHPMGRALGALRRVEWVDRVPVGGLRREDIITLLGMWTGRVDQGSEALAEWLLAETDGNAFFVTELMRHLDDTGQLDELAVRHRDRAALLPDSIREVLADRVARLGSAAETVLGTAAVIGSEFDLPVLAAVTHLPDQKLIDVLADAAAASLVRELPGSPGRYVFAHALVQQAMLVMLGPTRSASLHRKVAEELEAAGHDGAALDELAHHWLVATQISDTSRARDWARQAGQAALANLAPGDAVGYFRQALSLHDRVREVDLVTRIDLLVQLGEAERQASDGRFRETLLEACRLALDAGDGPRLVRAALANNIGTFSSFQGIDAERVAMLEAAIGVGAAEPGDRALLLATLANELTYSGDFARRRSLADEAIRMARDTGDPALVVRVLNHVFYALWVPDTLQERLALTEESLALVSRIDDPLLRYWVGQSSHLNLMQSGRVSDADALLDEIDGLADRLAQPALQWRVAHTQATRRLLAGDHLAAEALAARAAELGTRAGNREAGVYQKSQLMCVHWQRGTLPDLARRIDGTSSRPLSARSSLCLIFAGGDRHADAWRILDDVAAHGLGALPRDPAYVSSVASFAEGAIRLGHRTSAEVLREHVEPLVDQVGFDGVTTVGGLRHYAGGLDLVLGRLDDAVEELVRSAADHEAMGAPFFEARSRELLAEARLARSAEGDRPAAADELRRALELADLHGFDGVEHDAGIQLAKIDGG